MSIPARYSGLCIECGERWQPGDLIRSDQLNDVGMALWTHAVCPDALQPHHRQPRRAGLHRLLAHPPEGGRMLVRSSSRPALTWDNEGAPAGAGNTARGLTHSLDRSKEGLMPNSSRPAICAVDGCGDSQAFSGPLSISSTWTSAQMHAYLWGGSIA